MNSIILNFKIKISQSKDQITKYAKFLMCLFRMSKLLILNFDNTWLVLKHWLYSVLRHTVVLINQPVHFKVIWLTIFLFILILSPISKTLKVTVRDLFRLDLKEVMVATGLASRIGSWFGQGKPYQLFEFIGLWIEVLDFFKPFRFLWCTRKWNLSSFNEVLINNYIRKIIVFNLKLWLFRKYWDSIFWVPRIL